MCNMPSIMEVNRGQNVDDACDSEYRAALCCDQALQVCHRLALIYRLAGSFEEEYKSSFSTAGQPLKEINCAAV